MYEAWLESLPSNDELPPDEDIRISALLVSAAPGRIRLIFWPLCLEFKAEDVIEIKEIPVPPEAKPQTTMAVDVRLRCGAPLLAMRDLDTLPTNGLGGHLPFALATRPSKITLPPWTKYSAALSDYMRRHGLFADS
jgi:hypothetical protein